MHYLDQDFLHGLFENAAPLKLISLICILGLCYGLATVIYNVFLHPLRNFNGPILFAASRVPYVCITLRGRMATTLRDLHAVYGPIVRTAPNELSFIEPTAWKTIYGQRREGHAVFRKNYDGFHQNQSDLSHSVFIAGDEDHLRMRKVLNHAFSEKALREQEPLIQSHVDMLIKRLQEQGASNSNPVDLIKWYNWTAFDIVADLAFGEPLNCLTDSRYHHWVELLSEAWKVFSFVSALKSISPSNTFTRFLVPTSLIQKQLNHFNIILERVRKRIATGSERKDFITAISSNNTKNGMTSTEILSNASLLVAAGTETVATLLPAVTYLLAKNPETLSKAVSEIRGTCLKDEDLSIQDVKRLPYLAAAIDEALRLFPPVPEGLPRVTPSEGQHISGQFIPGGTFVQISPFAANVSATNFHEPERFLPERWLDVDGCFASDRKDVFQPFSMGPRNCVGQNLAQAKMRLIIAKMFWHFDIALCGSEPGDESWLNQKSYMLWKKKPLMVKLKPVVRET